MIHPRPRGNMKSKRHSLLTSIGLAHRMLHLALYSGIDTLSCDSCGVSRASSERTPPHIRYFQEGRQRLSVSAFAFTSLQALAAP